VRDNVHLLYGYKFFTSSTDADIALTLARVASPEGHLEKGGKGLALFLLHCARPSDCTLNSLHLQHLCQTKNPWNGIHLIRLKDKLGTRQMPTTELLLDNCVAYKLGETGSGVRNISHMLQMTRLYNAFGSVAAIRRVLSMAKDYSGKRVAFAKRIRDHPLHLRTLANLEIEARSSLAFCFQVRLLF
jgi:alkylation response protein AidB-like acyl-CoA dehydrogenase